MRVSRRTALLACLQFNANRGKQPAAKIEDFMPQKPDTAESIAASQRGFLVAFKSLADKSHGK